MASYRQEIEKLLWMAIPKNCPVRQEYYSHLIGVGEQLARAFKELAAVQFIGIMDPIKTEDVIQCIWNRAREDSKND